MNKFNLLELNRLIEHCKGKLETAATPETKKYYKKYLEELRQEKKELINKEFKK